MRSALACAVLVLASAGARAATPPEGVPLEVRRGFFTEMDIGVFWTMGGEQTYSNAQTYLQLGVGYDLTERLSLGLHLGLGSSAANCYAGFVPDTGDCRMPSNFSVGFGDATVAYNFRIAERLYWAPKLAAGITRLDPAPVERDGRTGGVLVAPNAGVGVGIEYATFMDHFSAGADVLARHVVGTGITTFAVFPRVKFTF